MTPANLQSKKLLPLLLLLATALLPGMATAQETAGDPQQTAAEAGDQDASTEEAKKKKKAQAQEEEEPDCE